MARNPFDETDAPMNFFEELRAVEERIGAKIDRHTEAVERKIEAVHGRISETDRHLAGTREEFVAHKARVSTMAGVVSVVVSAVVALASKLIPHGGQ